MYAIFQEFQKVWNKWDGEINSVKKLHVTAWFEEDLKMMIGAEITMYITQFSAL